MATALYPPIEPYETGRLKVSDIHELYYEQSGKKNGKPVVVLHGGPGGGSSTLGRQHFDPDYYRIIQFDQRGAGKSTPPAEIKENTTWDLVADVERLREHLGIARWMVTGGSWGSTLALAYCETYPQRVTQIIVRGIYTLSRWENVWVNQCGADALFPDYFESYIEPIPECERGDLLSAYHRRLTGDDDAERRRCALAWNRWEDVLSQLIPVEDTDPVDYVQELNHALIECHYFIHGGWLRNDTHLLDDAHKLRNIPGVIIQGRYDICCPMKTAWALHKVWPEAEFHIVPDAGHTFREPGIQRAILEATEKFKMS